MLRRLLGKDTAGRIGDGFRGRPDVDLSGYAASRGLDFRGQSSLAGYLGAFTFTPELQFNVLRGVLPGGRSGVLLHHVAILDPESASGQFYGKRTEKVGGLAAADFIPLTDLFSPNVHFFRLPETRIAFRLPASVSTLASFHVARRTERARGRASDDFLAARGLQLDEWRLIADRRADLDLLERVVRGPLGDALVRSDALGFTVEFAFGQLLVTRQDFLADFDELDAFCREAVAIADGIAALDPPGPPPADFDVALPEPAWLASVAASPDERYIDASSGAWLEPLFAYAQERSMRVEDPASFHSAFASLPLPGAGFGVAAGPGIRVAAACERRIKDIDVYKKQWPDAGLAVGCNMVLMPTSAPDTEPGDGVPHAGARHAVRNGVLLLYAIRPTWQFHAEAMDELVAAAHALQTQ